MNKIKLKQINFGGTDQQYVRGDGELASFPKIPTIPEIPEIENNYEEITYAQLYSKVSNSELIPGTKYRITDYVTTTSHEGTISAGHRFDLVVTAISDNKLDCKVSAAYNAEDNYFINGDQDISKWQIWYDINNDNDRYSWADINGKGVIYRMIDTFNNDCPYDFKNIMFRRKINEYGIIDETSGTETYVYTFNRHTQQRTNLDASLTVDVMNNYIARNSNFALKNDGDFQYEYEYYLNNNVFSLNDNYGYSHTCIAKNNKLYDNCYGNTFIGDASDNILHSNCFWNIFGPSTRSNIIGSGFHDSELGYDFNRNIIGTGCYNIITNGGFSDNYIGNYNSHINFVKNDGYCLQNLYVVPGLNYPKAPATTLTINTITTNRHYRTTVGRDSQGNIRIYNEDDPVEGGSSAENGVLNIHVNDAVIGQFTANQSSEMSVDIDFEAGTGISLEGNSQNGTITISAESNHTVINRQTILTAQNGQALRYYDVRCDLNGSVLKVGDLSDFVSPNKAYSYENKYVWTKQAGETGKYAGICKVQSTEGKYVFKIDFYDSIENKTTTHFFGVVADSPSDATFTFISTCNWEIVVRLNSGTHRLLAYLKIPDEFVGTITLIPLRRIANSMNDEGLTSSFDYSSGTTINDYYWYNEITENDGVQNVNTVTELAENAPETSSSLSGNYLRTPTGNYYVNVMGDFGGNLQVGSKVSDSVINDYYIHTIEKRLQDFATAAAIYTLLNLPQPTAGDEGKILIVNSSGQYELINPNNNTAQ